MSAGFTHLHVHTQYSLLDGAIRLPDLLEKCKEYGMDSVAITDHGAMYGALEFYTKAKKAGIKPIIGSELYIAPTSMREQKKVDGQIAYHIVLLAMNTTGYQNLMKLASIAQSDGFYYKPRIDMEVLREHNEGIIALTACLHGQVPYLIMNGDMDGAREKAQELYDIFGDRLYFELQENGIAEQTPVNDGLKVLAKEMGIKMVATNDCHYLNREEAHAHEVLLCIQTGKTITDTKRFRFSTDEFYFKSPETMKRAFHHCPEAIATTQEVADRCDVDIDLDSYYFPNFPVPEGETLATMFTDACWSGLEDRFKEMRELGTFTDSTEEIYKKRLEMEIGVINEMGFPAYFLIVADFIVWAKDNDIPVGPGRGSGAGSIAAYAMKITNIDPIPYGLIFERFLNIERKSMPDFDIDFCQDRRGEVIDYVRHKYGGAAHVAQIITYGTMKARGVIRDVGRALDIPFGEVDRIAKLVPDELKMTLKKALQQEPKLQEAADNDPQISELLSVSQTLEGLARHTSVHAAGVVISPEPMTHYLPTCRGNQEEERVTQYDMKHTEMTGLIKFDFLGLKTLTVIDKAVKHVHADKKIPLNIDAIPMDDPKTYDLLCRGDALGVFQLESEGMRELLVKMAPEQFSDLIALVALYRPGPLDSGMVDDFVETKHGRQEPHYPHPLLVDVLKETYGVIVYQEQVMKIASILGSYSLGDADILRRAMGKKIPEVMEEEKVKFMAGAERNKIDKDKAGYVFDLMAKFAGYGFNKSHSAAYALVSYQTAYLKAHHPAQFMAALLSCDMNNTDKVVRYINECKEQGIEVLPPDINESFKDFTVVNDRVRFGLAAVKNVGGSALDSIVEERVKDGPYKSIGDFCNRVDSRKVNSRVIESLIKSGSFDSLGYKRSQFMEVLDKAMEQAKAVQRDKQSGQISLFAVAQPAAGSSNEVNSLHMPDMEEWSDKQKLIFEKETVGFYITGHPLDEVLPELKTIIDAQIHDLADKKEDSAVRIGGLVRTFKKHRSQKGDAMAFISIEDIFEAVEVVVFPRTYAECAELLESDEPLVVLGRIQQSERGPKIIAETIDSIPRAREKYTDSIRLQLQAPGLDRIKLEKLKKHFLQYHGNCPVAITIHIPEKGDVDIDVNKDMTLRPCRELSDGVQEILGYPALTFKKKAINLPQRQKKWGDKKAA